jgi:hypothetical protein
MLRYFVFEDEDENEDEDEKKPEKEFSGFFGKTGGDLLSPNV